MRTSRGIGVAILLGWTLVVTMLRAVRWPNDFAEAHWLLDYRVGLIKRGLVGEVLGTITGLFGASPSEGLISALSAITFAALLVTLLVLALRLVARAGGSATTTVVMVAFLSSPFVVMSAHLMGYFDHLIVLMTVAALWLLRAGRPWLGATLLAVAVLVHENAILVGFPAFCLAWLLVDRAQSGRRSRGPSWAPLLLPVVAFVTLAVAGTAMDPGAFQVAMVPHLEQFPFVAGDMHIFVPEWLSASFVDSLREQVGHFGRRISSAEMLGLMLPTTLALAALVIGRRDAPLGALEVAALVVVCLAPQIMHIAAWDTVRIWTYTIIATFLALWIWSEVRGIDADATPVVPFLALTALAANVLMATPLLDYLADRYALTTRLWLYAPVAVACVVLVAGGLQLRKGDGAGA